MSWCDLLLVKYMSINENRPSKMKFFDVKDFFHDFTNGCKMNLRIKINPPVFMYLEICEKIIFKMLHTRLEQHACQNW